MTVHEICVETAHAHCAGCGALPDQPCRCQPPGVHYARLARARRAGYIGATDFASAISDADVFSGLTVLTDPGAVTP